MHNNPCTPVIETNYFLGSVQNVTTFGAFVDIGVGTCGLVHISRMKGMSLHVNQRIEVEVLDVEIARKRIGLAIKMT